MSRVYSHPLLNISSDGLPAVAKVKSLLRATATDRALFDSKWIFLGELEHSRRLGLFLLAESLIVSPSFWDLVASVLSETRLQNNPWRETS